MLKAPQKLRDTELAEKFKAGTLAIELAAFYGLSRQRVIQIVTKEGVSREDGGFSLRCKQAILAKNQTRATKLSPAYGITYAELEPIPEAARLAYSAQRRAVVCLKMTWLFTLGTWWAVWVKSGVFAERGTKKGQYRMERKPSRPEWSPASVAIQQLGASVIKVAQCGPF